jgi:Late competence development protein ComFB
MNAEFDSIHNYHQDAVFREVMDQSLEYPLFADNDQLLADVACIALNRLPPRYIRNRVDMAFFMDSNEHAKNAAAVKSAVQFAFEFVQSRANSASR